MREKWNEEKRELAKSNWANQVIANKRRNTNRLLECCMWVVCTYYGNFRYMVWHGQTDLIEIGVQCLLIDFDFFLFVLFVHDIIDTHLFRSDDDCKHQDFNFIRLQFYSSQYSSEKKTIFSLYNQKRNYNFLNLEFFFFDGKAPCPHFVLFDFVCCPTINTNVLDFFFHFHLFMDISSSPSSVQDSELKGKRWRISSNQALLNKHRWWCAEKADFYWLLLLDTVQSDRRQRLVMLLDQDVLAKLWLRALQQRFRVRQMLEMRLIMSTISIG